MIRLRKYNKTQQYNNNKKQYYNNKKQYSLNTLNNEYNEKQVVNSCMQYLMLKNYLVIRNNTGAIVIKGENNKKKRMIRFGSVGSSDIIACSPDGRFVAIECKKKGGKLTAYQEKFLNDVKEKNGIAIVAYSVDDLIKNGI